MNTTTATTTYEVKAGLPRGIQFHYESWECDTQEEATSLADNLAADGWKMIRIFEVATREITRLKTEKVTCMKVQKGTVILCSAKVSGPWPQESAEREIVPMTVAVIVRQPRTNTYFYYTSDGEYINKAGGRTLVEKVVA